MSYVLDKRGLRAMPRPISARVAAVAITYRWIVLVTAITVAFLSATVDGPGRFAVIGPLVVSVFVTALSLRTRFNRLLWTALVTDITLGATCVALTGGVQSPFVFYLSVPLVRLALHDLVGPLAIGTSATLIVLALLHVSAPSEGSELVESLNDVALILTAPWLLYVALHRASREQPHHDHGRRLDAEDLRLVRLLATGATYSQIAEDIDLSVETIKVRVARLYRRLGAGNRTEAVELANEFLAYGRDSRDDD